MSLFFQLGTDRVEKQVDLEDRYSGPFGSACFLIGGGPSLLSVEREILRDSLVPKMCLNLSGSRIVRPNFWTSYDPTARFHRSIYLIRRDEICASTAGDGLGAESTFKVCECPNLYFFDRDSERGFDDFLSLGHPKIIDWADSMVQAIDILYRLGFRRIYLSGCEMRVIPSSEQKEAAAKKGWNGVNKVGCSLF